MCGSAIHLLIKPTLSTFWSLEFSPNFGTLQINKSRLLCIFNAANMIPILHMTACADYGGPCILRRICFALKKIANKKIMCKDATTHYSTRTLKLYDVGGTQLLPKCSEYDTSHTVSAHSKPKSYCRASGSPVPPWFC